MRKDSISMRQLLVLLFVALLSPAIRVLPAETAAVAGQAGWLSSLTALPLALGLCWVFFCLMGNAPNGTGLAEVIEGVLGKVLGKGILLIYMVWALVLLCVNTRLCAQRFLATGYRNSSLVLFVAALVAVALWLSWGRLSAFARTGEVFYLILTLALGGVLLFALFHVEAENIFPIWIEDTAPVLWSSVPVLGVLGYAVFGVFLAGGVTRRQGDKARAIKWTAVFCLLLTAIQFINLGNFGPALIARMEQPFFMMVKGIGVQGAFQRVESVVIALWALSDIVFIGLLTFACCTLAKTLFGLKEAKHAAPPVTLLTLLGTLLLFSDAFSLDRFANSVVPAGNLLLGFLLPLVLVPVAALRKGHI